MSFFKNILSSLAGAKTLQQAKAASVDMESVDAKLSAVFANAGISLEAALADEGCIAKLIADAKDAGRAEMKGEIKGIAANVTALTSERDALTAKLSAFAGVTAALNLSADSDAATINEALAKRGSVEAARKLAAIGIDAPVADAPINAEATAGKSDADVYAEYNAIKDDQQRFSFYNANSAAIYRGMNAANKQ